MRAIIWLTAGSRTVTFAQYRDLRTTVVPASANAVRVKAAELDATS